MTISNLLQARCLIFAIYLAMRPVGRRVGQVVSDGPEAFEPLSVVLKAFGRTFKGFYKAFERPLKACKIPFNSLLRTRMRRKGEMRGAREGL